MAGAARYQCGGCENRLMAEVEHYEQCDYILKGCKLPKPERFKGTTHRECKDFTDTAGFAEYCEGMGDSRPK